MIAYMDGFDHYTATTTEIDFGTSVAVTAGVYAAGGGEINFNGQDGVPSRTGSYYVATSSEIRRVLGGNYRVAGLGSGYYFLSLTGGRIMSFRDADNNVQVSIGIDSTGAIHIWRGESDAELFAGSSPAVVAGAWQHIEARVDCDDTNGAVEVRVNGVTVANVTGVDTRKTSAASGGTGRIAQLTHGYFQGSGQRCHIDDIFAWVDTDASDDLNNDFIGDRKVATLFPTQDTSVAEYDFVGDTDGGYACIDDPAPDGDTTYIEFDLAGETGDFIFGDLGSEAAVVTAVQTYVNMKKTDAGPCDMQVSLLSNGEIDLGTSRPITTAYTYWMDVSELNPDTGSPWTPAQLNAAGLRIDRTA